MFTPSAGPPLYLNTPFIASSLSTVRLRAVVWPGRLNCS